MKDKIITYYIKENIEDFSIQRQIFTPTGYNEYPVLKAPSRTELTPLLPAVKAYFDTYDFPRLQNEANNARHIPNALAQETLDHLECDFFNEFSQEIYDRIRRENYKRGN